MAVIGDVLVKLVADFAEFSKGMQESASSSTTSRREALWLRSPSRAPSSC